MHKPIVVFTTLPISENNNADRLIEALLKSRLCACVNKIKVDSFYWWENKIQKDREFLLIIKTTEDKLEDLETWIKENHPYTVPEFIAIEVKKISEPYYEWLLSEVR